MIRLNGSKQILCIYIVKTLYCDINLCIVLAAATQLSLDASGQPQISTGIFHYIYNKQFLQLILLYHFIVSALKFIMTIITYTSDTMGWCYWVTSICICTYSMIHIICLEHINSCFPVALRLQFVYICIYVQTCVCTERTLITSKFRWKI